MMAASNDGGVCLRRGGVVKEGLFVEVTSRGLKGEKELVR